MIMAFLSAIQLHIKLVVVAHTFNPSSWEAEAGGSLSVRGQSGLQSEFKDSQCYYTEKPISKNQKKKKIHLF